MGEKGDKIRELADNADEQERLTEEMENLNKWLISQPIIDEHEIAKRMCLKFQINLSEAKKNLEKYPMEYKVEDKYIPDIVKDMRKYRRKLKGDNRDNMSKSIDTLVYAYGDYLGKCVDSIYWVKKYKSPLTKMKGDEKNLKKIYSIKDGDTRQKVIDSVCKFWEADLDIKGVPYGKEYASLSKSRTSAKKELTSILKNITHQSIRKNFSEKVEEYVIKKVSENQGISAREIHETMELKMFRKTSPFIISKMSDKINLTNIDGRYYKLDMSIKKDLYAYTAAFIDSDGYITMDKKGNPRVGLVATGDRGKAFMVEMHKSLGVGKLHLDQKSPQNTRPVNRLNFYSQGDVRELLLKCRPFFRMKGEQADTLLELIRIKKEHKKQDWAKPRIEELFKLMKWYNHKDHVGFDFSPYGIDAEVISKLEGNNKMGIMDGIEQAGVVA